MQVKTRAEKNKFVVRANFEPRTIHPLERPFTLYAMKPVVWPVFKWVRWQRFESIVQKFSLNFVWFHWTVQNLECYCSFFTKPCSFLFML